MGADVGGVLAWLLGMFETYAEENPSRGEVSPQPPQVSLPITASLQSVDGHGH
jgi:hypothetical protein